MPKRAINLWEQLVSWDNLLCAAKGASRDRRYKAEVLRYNERLEENLLELRERLEAGQWRPGPYKAFEVYEPKLRMVHAPIFADRVFHHALVQVIGPCFERRFLDHSYACRKGRGTHAASSQLSAMLRSARDKFSAVYVLKADISKYFYSIDHDILLNVIERIIADRKILELVRRLIKECGCIDGSRGLPLGALTSQLFANAYLDRLDHFIKEELRVHYYVRYMDDFVILHDDKKELWRYLAEVRDYLDRELKLSLNRKTRVFPASQGIDFAGYRHWADHVLPRKRNVKRAKKRFARLNRDYAEGRADLAEARSLVASFIGYMRHCKGWKTAGSALSRICLRKPHG